MTRILIALLLLPAVLAPVAAVAADRGLDAIEITPAQPPADPDAMVKMLEKHPGFLSASWDADNGVFTVAVEDSMSLSTQELRRELTEEGLEPAEMDLLFETVNAEVGEGVGWLLAKENDFRLPALWTMNARRFWGFHGANPRGQNADFRMRLKVVPGALDSLGVAASDSVEVVHFELTVPAYVEKKK
jgi:hypothetical protein